MEFSVVVVCPVTHNLLIDTSSKVKMSLITEKQYRVVRDVFKKSFTCISLSIKVALGKLLHTIAIFYGQKSSFMQNTSYGTIRNFRAQKQNFGKCAGLKPLNGRWKNRAVRQTHVSHYSNARWRLNHKVTKLLNLLSRTPSSFRALISNKKISSPHPVYLHQEADKSPAHCP